ncbi:MAG UNVERIFIED_CONTAM: hypothetical protein LVT10_10515 [Anaerolineae bacterium]
MGSGCQDAEQYKKAMKQSHDAITIINKNGHQADMVDIGGGFLPNQEQFERYAREFVLSYPQMDKSIQ